MRWPDPNSNANGICWFVFHHKMLPPMSELVVEIIVVNYMVDHKTSLSDLETNQTIYTAIDAVHVVHTTGSLGRIGHIGRKGPSEVEWQQPLSMPVKNSMASYCN